MFKIRSVVFFCTFELFILLISHTNSVAMGDSTCSLHQSGTLLVRIVRKEESPCKSVLAQSERCGTPTQGLAKAKTRRSPLARFIKNKYGAWFIRGKVPQRVHSPQNLMTKTVTVHKPQVTKEINAKNKQAVLGLRVASMLIPAIGELPDSAVDTQFAMYYRIVPRMLDATAIDEIERIIEYRFKNKELLIQAFTTRTRDPQRNYERFEFLGDKILDASIAQILLGKYPMAQEGYLTSARVALVSQEPLAALCIRLGLHHYIQDVDPAKIPIATLCDIIESLIAALHSDGGPEVAQNFVVKFFTPMLSPLCPLTGQEIIGRAAKELKRNIEIVWDKKRAMLSGFLMKEGEGSFVNPPRLKLDGDPKKDPNRLILYLAVRNFIKNRLPAEYADFLMKLAIDPDYHPLLDDEPKLDLQWAQSAQTNCSTRLASLMKKLDYEPPYTFQKNAAEGEPFLCTMNLFGSVVTRSGETRTIAQENVAEVMYKKLQNLILFSKDLSKGGLTYEFNMNDPVASFSAFCAKQGLDVPQYTEETTEKNSVYSVLTASWLMIPLKGKATSTGLLARAEAAKRAITLIKHLARYYIDPKKLSTFDRYTYVAPMDFLKQLCCSLGIKQPCLETRYCEGPVTEPLYFKTLVALTNMNKKMIIGEKATSKSVAQSNAAKKAALYLVNKMIAREIQPIK